MFQLVGIVKKQDLVYKGIIMVAPLTIGPGIAVGGGITVGLASGGGGGLTIATNDGGGLTGWNSQALSVSYNPVITSTYGPGSTITFQDSTTATITQIDDYGPIYIDIFWNTPKTGNLFPITLT